MSLKTNIVVNHPLIRPLARFLWDSQIGEIYRSSSGDWRYPIFAFRWRIISWLTPRQKIQIGDVKFILTCVNWITHFRWYLFKRKEPEVRYFFEEYMKDGDIVFDIGANVGVFSLYAARCKRDIRVYAVEPEIKNNYLLLENIVENRLERNIQPICAAVGERIEWTRLYLSSHEIGSAVHSISDISIESTNLGYKVVGQETVFSITLDYLSETLGVVPQMLKIDTDGKEVQILRGGEKVLKDDYLRGIVIEMPIESSKAMECREILSAAGFINRGYPSPRTLNEIWVREE